MTPEEAEKQFEKQLKIECPHCDAPVGAFCLSEGVWIHLQRFRAAENATDETPLPRWQQIMNEKNRNAIEDHENKYGKLGVLRVHPTQEQLDKDFKARKAKGELFTQQREAE